MDGSGKVVFLMELVLLVVGVCLSIDVVDIFKKGCFNIEVCNCELEVECVEELFCVFIKI